MTDIPRRAARARVTIELANNRAPKGVFDLVFCDAPCSGSGAWRRTPQAKWMLTPDRLKELQQAQDAVLEAAKDHVAVGGQLVYVTCSVIKAENSERCAAFLGRNPGWQCAQEERWPLDSLGDGFYFARFLRL